MLILTVPVGPWIENRVKLIHGEECVQALEAFWSQENITIGAIVDVLKHSIFVSKYFQSGFTQS